MKDLGKVCVCGLGTIGLPTACYIQKRGFETYGYDIRNVEGPIETFTVWDEVPNVDVYVVTVNTKAVPNICEIIDKTSKNALICIESTMLPGTCRRLAQRYGFNLMVHCPHRFWKENQVKHGVQQLRLLGALNKQSLEKAKRFYNELNIPVHMVSNLETAELAKVAENSYRYVLIAFVEELYRICGKLNLNFNMVREAVNTKWNVRLLEARIGIKGRCLPKDINYLRQLTTTPLLDGAVETDSIYRKMFE